MTIGQAVKDAVETALRHAALDDDDVRIRPASKLSGGMRRRLSVVSKIQNTAFLAVEWPIVFYVCPSLTYVMCVHTYVCTLDIN